jgi:hypothetical protein
MTQGYARVVYGMLRDNPGMSDEELLEELRRAGIPATLRTVRRQAREWREAPP